jgi:DNA-binding IclR family transcriptional regulator
VSDVARRWQLERSTCEQLLEELADRQVLVADAEGIYELARSE